MATSLFLKTLSIAQRERPLPQEALATEYPREVRRRLLLGLEERRPPAADHWIRVHRTAMACRFEITLSGEDAHHLGAAREVLEEADRIEELLTVFRDSSEVSRLNARGGQAAVTVSDELFGLLERAASLHAATAGAFDPTATPLLHAWGFLRREGRRPDPESLDAVRVLVGMEQVGLDPALRTVRLGRPGMQLSFGSLGKGYALDRMADGLRQRSVPRALLSAGGSSVVGIGGGDEGFPVEVRSKRTRRGRLFRGLLQGSRRRAWSRHHRRCPVRDRCARCPLHRRGRSRAGSTDAGDVRPPAT
jgi:hypothetical protein